MKHKPSFAMQVQRRIFHFQKTVSLDTMEMRHKWVTELDGLFDIATSTAKGKISQQQVGDKLQMITPKERQMWAQIAANIGMVMGNLTKAYDEREFDEDLAELERQVKELIAIREEEAKENFGAVPRPWISGKDLGKQ